MKTLLLTLFILLFASCSFKHDAFNDAKEHMMESEELRVLMHELDMVIYDRFKSELDRDNSRSRYASTLAQTLKNLAIKLENVEREEFAEKLKKNDSITYKRYVKELYQNSEEIQGIANSYEFERLQTSLDKVERTCNGCHQSFRSR